ncbi:MAG: serine hydrolase domain-containing protein [Devosia sp.]
MDLTERVNAAIDAATDSRIVGCVVLVRRGGRLIFSRAAGFADREQAWPVAENTIFRLASVTKPIVATTALRMIDLGLLSLDDNVASYLPYFTPKAADGSTPDITIRHLLTHTSGITYDNPPLGVALGADPSQPMPLTENLRRLSHATLAFLPGTAWHYGMSIDVLGGVLAAINKSDLEGVIANYVTGPLHMDDTHFLVTDKTRLAHPYGDGTPRPFRMSEPQAIENAPGKVEMFSPRRIFQTDTPQSGGAGMAGTASDLMKLLEALRGGFLKLATRDEAFSNQIGALPRDDAGQKFGFLGAVVEDTAASGWPVAGMLHWGGIWGNNWILDPASATTVVVYTNTMREGCNGPFRDEIRDAVFA